MTKPTISILNDKQVDNAELEQFMLGHLSATQIVLLGHMMNIANIIINMNIRGKPNLEELLTLKESVHVLCHCKEFSREIHRDRERIREVVEHAVDLTHSMFPND